MSVGQWGLEGGLQLRVRWSEKWRSYIWTKPRGGKGVSSVETQTEAIGRTHRELGGVGAAGQSGSLWGVWAAEVR